MTDVPEIFGSMVFNDSVMKNHLPKDSYKVLQKTIQTGQHLDLDVANVVAAAMKDWAISLGATHYTHWFQPMTGVTAEKHDGFISPDGDGKIIMEFSGKELVKGESDASSFPSGGIRATFEARGYTAWDPTSFAFVKDNTLYIPTVFCSYTGDVLDKKTPLLRSMEALDIQTRRILKLFGKKVVHVDTTVGPEQEYFLIDKEMYLKRPDLMYCGRTLFGSRPAKGQALEDHYYGAIKPRVAAFMKDLDRELWKLGILAKTEHNEVAPAQHELAPIFCTANLACDHNQLTMELMKTVADRHGMYCLLHEKPFAGVNGSGKHNNWSISADGVNLLEPGDTPEDNAQFLLFLSAVIKGVDEYADLLRLSVATAGNDNRLGASEAPPAIISMFLGDELTAILDSIETGKPYKGTKKTMMEIGATVLPHFPKDTTDRNRTSPFAFTGNKFEFRSLGASLSISCPNIMLNTIVAEELSRFSDILERGSDFKADLNELIRKTIKEHKRVIFNGDGYAAEWPVEAKKRGLPDFATTPDALPQFLAEKNLALFKRHKVFTEKEVCSRYEILMENYCKVIHIEAATMIGMVRKQVIPAVLQYQKMLADTVNSLKAAFPLHGCRAECAILSDVSALFTEMFDRLVALEHVFEETKQGSRTLEDSALFYRDRILAGMNALRPFVDRLETVVAKEYWRIPTYEDMLYSVN